MTPPNIYEFKTPYQTNLEKFSEDVNRNSRKIRESERSVEESDISPKDEPKKKNTNQHMSISFS